MSLPSSSPCFWGACKGIILVPVNLARKGMDVSKGCPRCGLYAESIIHALLSCTTAATIWFISLLGLRCVDVVNGTFLDWVDSLAKVLDLDLLSTVGMIAWGIWSQRNDTIHGKKVFSPHKIVVHSLRVFFP